MADVIDFSAQQAAVEQPVTENETKEEVIEGANGKVLTDDIKAKIKEKAEELKAKNKLRKVFAVTVNGDDDDDKPLYVAYLRRPNLIQFSQYMSFAQKDVVQANKMLAQSIFLDGDRELVDDEELFLYGLMPQLANLLESRSSELLKR